MASLMENLIEVLDKECSEYEVLLALSQRKTPIIVGGNLEELQKITDEEQEVVSRVGNLEKRRVTVTADIANVLNKDVNTLKLAHLVEMLAGRPSEQRSLAESHDRLQRVIGELQRINEHNRELLSNALEMVEFELNMYQAMKAAPETANYNRSAYNSGEIMGVNRGFDTKQ